MMDVLLSRDKYVQSVRPFRRRDNTVDVLVSVSFHRGGWEIRWRDAEGRRRARRFPTEDTARAFDAALAEISPGARRADTARHGRSGGVYSYRAADGVRWRFVYRRSDGTQTTRRGFMSERAARDAAPAGGAGRTWRGASHEGDVPCLLGAVACPAPAVSRTGDMERLRDRWSQAARAGVRRELPWRAVL